MGGCEGILGYWGWMWVIEVIARLGLVALFSNAQSESESGDIQVESFCDVSWFDKKTSQFIQFV